MLRAAAEAGYESEGFSRWTKVQLPPAEAGGCHRDREGSLRIGGLGSEEEVREEAGGVRGLVGELQEAGHARETESVF